MAIFHLHMKTISRSKGRFSTAAAAYRSGCRIYDQRSGLTFDYRNKKDVDHTELVNWDGTRSELWNMAEKKENRKNSCVAREIEFALPIDIPADHRVTIAREFCMLISHRYQIAGDLAIHHLNGNNPHCHYLITTRKINDGLLTDKTRILDNKKTGPSEVEILRGTWSKMVNEALSKAGINEKIDHRSYKRQGLTKKPSRHLGYNTSKIKDYILRLKQELISIQQQIKRLILSSQNHEREVIENTIGIQNNKER